MLARTRGAHTHEHEYQLLEVCAQLQDAVCRFDAEGRFTYANPAFERLLGIASDIVYGRKPSEIAELADFGGRCTRFVETAIARGSTVAEEIDLDIAASPHRLQWHVIPHQAGGAVDTVTVLVHDITEELLAMKALERAETEVGRILESIAESFIMLDREWRFTYVNERVMETTGIGREYLLGKNIWEAFPILVGTEFEQQLRRVMDERSPVLFTANLAGDRWWDVHCYRAENGVSVYLTEVTDRKRAEQAVIRANEVLSALIQASPLPIVALTLRGEITLWNSAAERVFGWTAEEVTGKPLPFIPAEKMDEHQAMRKQDLKGAGFTDREIRRTRKDGSWVDLSVSTAPIRDASGSVSGIMSVYQDITGRKQVEAELRDKEARIRQSEEWLRVATLSAGVGVWFYEVEQDQLVLSALSSKLLGFPERLTKMTVRAFLDRLHPEDRETTVAAIHRSVNEGVPYDTEYRVVAPDGSVRWIAAKGLSSGGEAGKPARFSGIAMDVTQRKSFEQELEEQRRELARSNADLQQFAFVTSHDLQEPLRNISSYCELLARRYGGALDEDAREYLGFISGGSRRMQGMINDLLAFSRVLHISERAPERVDLETVFSWAIMNLNTAIRESGAQITHDPLPEIAANQQEMIQLFQNLLGNAMKYRGADPPVIHVGCSESEDTALFSVRDNGVGIAPEYHEQVFRIFTRLHGREVPGTGIGLALCHRIVEKHGGRIWVVSEPGKGADFRFTLPLG